MPATITSVSISSFTNDPLALDTSPNIGRRANDKGRMTMPEISDNIVSIVQKAKEDEIEKRVYERIKQDLTHLKFFGIGGSAIFGLFIWFS